MSERTSKKDCVVEVADPDAPTVQDRRAGPGTTRGTVASSPSGRPYRPNHACPPEQPRTVKCTPGVLGKGTRPIRASNVSPGFHADFGTRPSAMTSANTASRRRLNSMAPARGMSRPSAAKA